MGSNLSQCSVTELKKAVMEIMMHGINAGWQLWCMVNLPLGMWLWYGSKLKSRLQLCIWVKKRPDMQPCIVLSRLKNKSFNLTDGKIDGETGM